MSHLLFLLRFVKHRWLGNALSIKRNECRRRDVYWPQSLLWINMSTLLPLCSCWHFVPLENLRLVSSSWMYMGKVWTCSCPVAHWRLGCPGPDVLPTCSIIKHATRDGVSGDKMDCLLFEKYISTALNYASKFYHRIPTNKQAITQIFPGTFLERTKYFRLNQLMSKLQNNSIKYFIGCLVFIRQCRTS